jgi:hypothetical protein
MNSSLLFFTLVMLLLSTDARMSMSESRHLGQAQNHLNSVRSVLGIENVQRRLLFEQSMGISGGSTSGPAGVMTLSDRAEISHRERHAVDTNQAKIMSVAPRELQTAQSMSFEQVCSTVAVSVCSVTESKAHGFSRLLNVKLISLFYHVGHI